MGAFFEFTTKPISTSVGGAVRDVIRPEKRRRVIGNSRGSEGEYILYHWGFMVFRMLVSHV